MCVTGVIWSICTGTSPQYTLPPCTEDHQVDLQPVILFILMTPRISLVHQYLPVTHNSPFSRLFIFCETHNSMKQRQFANMPCKQKCFFLYDLKVNDEGQAKNFVLVLFFIFGDCCWGDLDVILFCL